MNNFYRISAVVELFDHEQHEITELYHEEEMIEYGDIKDPANLIYAQLLLSNVLSDIEKLAETYEEYIQFINTNNYEEALQAEREVAAILLGIKGF